MSNTSAVRDKAKAKKKKQLDALVEFCYTEVSIECTECRSADGEFNVDDVDAAKEFYKRGWRTTNENCYCPDCAKKHLKSKTKP